MKKTFLLTLTLLFFSGAFAQNETEPNNSIATADATTEGVVFSGSVGSTDNDYFKSMPVDDGTIKVYLTFNSSDPTADIFFYARARNGGSIGTSYQYNHSTISGTTDTITIGCRQRDSLYLRVQGSGGSSNYTIRYERIVPGGPNDTEPNNAFAEATLVNFNAITKGRVGYSGIDGIDANDYYKVVMPDDGSFQYIIDYYNPTPSSTPNIFSYIGNRAGGNLGTNYSYNRTLGAYSDTITMHCRQADTFTIRIQATGCFSYSFRTNLLNVTGINDAEPNNSFSEATLVNFNAITKGRVGYSGIDGIDANDYYKVVMPNDGSFQYIIDYYNPTPSSTPNIFSYIGNRASGNLGTNYSYNRTLGAYSDTITIHCRQADTFTIRIQATGCFSYSFRTNLLNVTGINDAEPNNSFAESTLVGFKDTTRGRIGYKGYDGTDANDYYRVIMPDDGTFQYILDYHNATPSGSPNIFSYIQNRNGTSTLSANYSYNNDTGYYSDTITIHCRQADTFTIRIQATGCFSYSFTTNLLNVTGINDAEPNNSFAESTLVGFNDTTRGRIGYKGYTSTDNYDYYKAILPGYGKLRYILDYHNPTPSGSPNIFSYIGNKTGTTLKANYSYNQSQGHYSDTITLNCVQADTFSLRIQSTGCFSYSVRFEFESQAPVANMEYEIIGDAVGFRPQLARANEFVWDFGDGTTSTLQYPLHTYNKGIYTAQLIASNTQCNLKDTNSQMFEFKGIEYYTPNKGGTGGDVTMKIFGGGLDSTTIVKLIKGGTVIEPVNKASYEKRNQLDAVFDLHTTEQGVYDVEITIAGEDPLLYEDGFTVNEFKYPYTWSRVVAAGRYRNNVDNKGKLVIGNTGNVNAAGVLVMVVWPKSVDLTFDTEWFKPPTSGAYTVEAADTVFNFRWEDIQYIYSDSFVHNTPLDSFDGLPYDGYARLLMIPKIAPNSTYEIPLILNSSGTGPANIYTYTIKPNIFGSGTTGSMLDVSENLAVEAINIIDMGVSAVPALDKSPVGWLVKATKGTTKHMANLGQAMGAFYNYASGTTNSLAESLPSDYCQNVSAGNSQMASAVLEIGVDKLVEGGADKLLKGQQDRLLKHMSDPNATARSMMFALDNIKDVKDMREQVKNMYKNGKDVKTLLEKYDRLYELMKDCPDLKDQANDLKAQIDKELQKTNISKTGIRFVTSMDPNEIIGPLGVDDDRFIVLDQQQSFLITFENVDSAEIGAQVVTIIDTLDMTKFDLSTFEFGDISIDTRTFEVANRRKQFVQEEILNDTMSVRINGEIDLATGIVTWQFTAIDRATNDLPFIEGFLPPNKTKPEGEGSVSFYVKLLPTLADATVVQNKASIIFDTNDPIITNTWSNTIDIGLPSSTISASRIVGTDTVEINFTGTDVSSGIGYYNLYIKRNDEDWIALGGSSLDKILLTAPRDQQYSFYAKAIDYVGNIEDKPAVAEVTLSEDKMPVPVSPYKVVPNPSSNEIRVEGITNFVEYSIIDVLGNVIMVGGINNPNEQIDIESLVPGMYIIQLNDGEINVSLKWIKSN